MSEVAGCNCVIKDDVLTVCEGHTLELANLLANPPAWAIRARGGK